MNFKALVLTGGSIKGAWQSGAIKAVLDNGYEPNIITGISVGSLNGAFLTNELAKKSDWRVAGGNLVRFWKEKIKKPSDIIIKKSAVRIGWDILWKKFDGIVSVEPLRKLLQQVISLENIRKSPVMYRAGYVVINSGEIIYENNMTANYDTILASTAIPFTMPLIHGKWADGGIRDNAPLKEAIKAGATEIIVIATSPETLDYSDDNWGDVFKYADRLMTIIVNNTLNDDLAEAEYYNRFCSDDGSVCPNGPAAGKRKISLKVIRPFAQINVSIENFTEKDIIKMINDGYSVGKNSSDNK